MRIVSLCPSVTDTVFALGAGAELVGRSKFCVQPKGLVEAVPRVGGTKNPHLDEIIALAPDVVLMNDEENRREDAEALAAAGLRVWSAMPRTVLETARAVLSLGTAIDRLAAATALAEGIGTALREANLANARGGGVRFAYLIWRKPWMAVNGDTYISDLCQTAGGANVFAGQAERYAEITPEMLAAADPARIWLSSEPFPFAARHADELAAATGLSRERFVLVDGELLSWHGARTVDGLVYARRLVSS